MAVRVSSGDDGAELGLVLEGAAARRTVDEVLPDHDASLLGQLVVDVLVDVLDCVLTTAHGVGSTSPCSTARFHNFLCSAFLPRCSRDITVPIGTSRISAISL